MAATRKPILIDVQTLAQLLGRSPQSICRDDHRGRLPKPIRLGSSKRWDLAEIEEWVRCKCPSRESWEARQRREAPANTGAGAEVEP